MSKYHTKKEIVLFGVNDGIVLKAFVPEIKIRMNKGKAYDVDSVKSSADVYELLKKIYGRNPIQEHFLVLLFNRANKLIGYYKHTIGGSTSTIADVTMIVGLATKALAHGIIVSHNHPSGSLKPSDPDQSLTEKLNHALKLVDITLLDHVIYTNEGYYSFLNEGKLNGITNTRMITVENLIAKYPHISQDSLPTALQQSEFEFIQENIDLYNEDETIKKYIDTFVEKLNESEPDRHKSGKANKQKAEPKVRTTKQPKQPKQKAEKRVDDIVPDDVEFISPEVKFIKRFVGLNEKQTEKSTILSFINALQRSIVEKRIRKTSDYAKEIEKIQNQLIECHNQMGKTIKISIVPETLEKYIAITKSEQVAATVKLIKQYIALHGKTDVKKKAKSLYDRIDKAINNGDISHNDVRYNEIHEIEQALIAYLQDATDSININQTTLNGLMGIIGESVTGLNGLENTETVSPKLVPSETLSEMQFNTIGLQGKYRNLIGDPSRGFTAMVYGLPKSGKSTLCIDFAKYLAEHHGKVLYVAIEEGFGYTLQEKFERLNATHPNLVIAETLPTDLSKWDFVFIDSVSKAGLSIEQLVKLHKQFPKTAFIFIFHSTKDGNFRGGQGFAHEVDCIIDVEDGVASANGRFGVGGTLNVFND